MSDKRWGDICNGVDSCALCGAAAFFAGVPRAEIIANGPLWCYYYAMRRLEHTDTDIDKRFFVSQPDNNAIVYGTEKFLRSTMKRIFADGHEPSLLFVENSCAVSLIGDDMEGILAEEDLPYPTLAMDCGGITGGFAEGWSKAFITLLKRTKIKDCVPEEMTVNLLGLTDFYWNGAADREEIVRILEKCGCHINLIPGCHNAVEEYENIGKAALNIVFNEELGLKVAKKLEAECGTPYFLAGIPYGTEGTVKWLKRLQCVLPELDTTEIEAEAEKTAKKLLAVHNEFTMFWGALHFENILVAAPGTQALCFAEALLKEWTDADNLTVILAQPLLSKKQESSVDENEEKAVTGDVRPEYCSVADTVLVTGRDSEAIEEYYGEINHLLSIASSSETAILMRKKDRVFGKCNLAYPVKDEMLLTDTPFVGIRGAGHVLQRLWNELIRMHIDGKIR